MNDRPERPYRSDKLGFIRCACNMTTASQQHLALMKGAIVLFQVPAYLARYRYFFRYRCYTHTHFLSCFTCFIWLLLMQHGISSFNVYLTFILPRRLARDSEQWLIEEGAVICSVFAVSSNSLEIWKVRSSTFLSQYLSLFLYRKQVIGIDFYWTSKNKV